MVSRWSFQARGKRIAFKQETVHWLECPLRVADSVRDAGWPNEILPSARTIRCYTCNTRHAGSQSWMQIGRYALWPDSRRLRCSGIHDALMMQAHGGRTEWTKRYSSRSSGRGNRKPHATCSRRFRRARTTVLTPNRAPRARSRRRSSGRSGCVIDALRERQGGVGAAADGGGR